jgi:hypothetical protein
MSLGSTEMETLRAAMKPKTMVIAYWADSELAFIDFTRKLCESAGVRLSLVKIAHEPNWFSENKSLLRNGAHLARIFSRIIALGLYGRVVSFGTNSNRILFLFSWLFKNVYYVYNELPALSKFSPAAWIDRAVFRFARHVSVSTVERAEFIKQAYRLERSLCWRTLPSQTSRRQPKGKETAQFCSPDPLPPNALMIRILTKFQSSLST